MCNFIKANNQQCKLAPKKERCHKHEKKNIINLNESDKCIGISIKEEVKPSTMSPSPDVNKASTHTEPIYSNVDTSGSKINNTSGSKLFNQLFTKTLNIKPNSLLKLTDNEFTEVFDRNKLAFILNNEEEFMKDTRPDARNCLSLAKYYLNSNKEGEIDVTYKQSHASSLRGRLQAIGAVSAQAMIREARHVIFDGFYVDLDIDNCHPVIQVWICDNVGVECEKLRYYVDHREQVIADLIVLNPELCREDFKKLFLSINYGGSSIYKNVKHKNQFLIDYYKESAELKKQLCAKFTKFSEKANIIRKAAKKTHNMDGAAVSHLCCFIENQLLMIIYNFLEKKMGCDIQQSVLCFDGIMIPADNYEDSFIMELEKIFVEWQIPIKLSVKPFKPVDLEKYGFDESIEYTYIDPFTLRSTDKGIPAICDARIPGDIDSEYPKLQNRKVTLAEVHTFIVNNIAFISNKTVGSIYITRGMHTTTGSGSTFKESGLTFRAMDANKAKDSWKGIKLDLIGNFLPIQKNLWHVVNKYRGSITYTRRDFIPYGAKAEPWDYSSDIFNSFDGFLHPWNEDFVIDYSKIQRFRDHLKNIWADGNEKLYICIEKWFALILQQPNKKTQTCLVLTGDEGLGKNITTDIFRDHVLGAKYMLEVSDITKVTQRFNSCIEDKIFTILNEAANVGPTSHGVQEILKDLITASTQVIELKGKEPYTINDRNNYICFSNNEFVIKASKDLRRFVFLRGSEAMKGNAEYFNNLMSDFEKHDAGIHLYHYFMDIDISDFNPQRDFPITEMKKELQASAIPKPHQYLIHLVNSGLEDEFYSSSTLFDMFNEFLIRSNDKAHYTKDRFMKEIVRLGIVSVQKRFGGCKTRGVELTKDMIMDRVAAKYRRSDLFDL